tara:strand:+ start:2415 stop:2933 length:519 start_codon:yes stop_codon:yes gene_type:complete
MIRDYKTGEKDSVTFFTGVEVEKTPAYGMKTLFVVGLQDPEDILTYITEESCTHVFFGANHSYDPKDTNEYIAWENMIQSILKEGYLCSLDIPITIAEEFLESGLVENDNFIPQLRVPVPYAKMWNYNTMLKIDDKDFKASNPGVWCHSLHDLMNREKFTDWTKYGLDKVLK